MHYKDLTIRNFRGIKDLTLPELGRVNLLAGKNNTGKSSVLEAVRLHAQNGDRLAIYGILRLRDGNIGPWEYTSDYVEPDSAYELSTLFRGFPTLADEFRPIRISARGKSSDMKLKLDVGWELDKRDAGDRRILSGDITPLPSGPDDVPVLRVATGTGFNVYLLEAFINPFRHQVSHGPTIKELVPCQMVSSNSGRSMYGIGRLWEKIALTDYERNVVDALRILDENIEGFSVIGQGRSRAMVRAKSIDHPVPLSSFGDGMNRMLRIMLSLVNARGGVLLVDEFENGLHYSAQIDAWRMVFKLARDLDVQVFATTHSWDAISAFQKAAGECEDAGVLIRLNRRWGEVIPTVYPEDELAMVDKYRIEVR